MPLFSEFGLAFILNMQLRTKIKVINILHLERAITSHGITGKYCSLLDDMALKSVSRMNET